jgi:hypothetical protein
MANNIVLQPQAGNSFALIDVISAYKQPSAFQPIGVTVYGTASIPANANNALAGKALTISGFSSAGNNGTFLVLSSTATSVTTNNANGVVGSGSPAGGTASFETQSFPTQYSSKNRNLWSNQNGDSAAVNVNTGDTLVAVVIGLKSYGQFDLLHGTAPYGSKWESSPVEYNFEFGQLQGLNDFNANPTITDQANGVPVDIVATSVTSNVLTVTLEENASTALVASQSVLISNTQESFLNGQTVIVSTYTAATFVTLANGQVVQATPAKFTAPFTHTNYSNADDTGTATPAGNTWSLATHQNIIDSDYTGTFTAPAGPAYPSYTKVGNLYYLVPPAYAYEPNNQWPSSKWNLDGYYPSIYVFIASNVKAGSYKVNLNSMYQPGDANNLIDWSEGAVPIFDGGVNLSVFVLSGCATSSAVEAVSISTTETTSNPATAPASLVVSNADGDALISVALTKSNNVLAPGSVGGTATSLSLTAVAPLLYGTGSQYPLQNYGGSVYTGTITGGANNAFVGYTFTVTGFTNAANNGTFTCTASTATTLTLSNGVAVAQTGASGSAAYTPLTKLIGSGVLVGSEAHYMIEYALTSGTGTFNPGFQNPLGYAVLVASVAIKSS